ncbi:MAG: tetratricopeptide repeat protein [Kiritimatiellae bacterium]|nr:tetratricopeptide repeat protein [Kiritimatiellia bacterium]
MTADSRAQRQETLAALAIALATLLVYAPALRGGFFWDDEVAILKDPLVHAPDGLLRMWFSTEAADYFPLTSSLFWLEWRLFGSGPLGYHAVNVLLHALNAVLLWRVLRELRVPGAWYAGLLFAVHPVNAASAAWITEQKNTLSMALFLGAVLCFLRHDSSHGGRNPAPGAEAAGLRTRKRRWDRLALGLFVLALLGKTSVVMGPFVLLGCMGWRHGRLCARHLRETIPFFAAAVALGLVTVWFQTHNAIAGDVPRSDGFASRLATAGRALSFYARKAVFPYRLSILYPRWSLPAQGFLAFTPVAGLAAGAAVLWVFRRTWARPWLFGLGSFAVMLFPVLGFFDMYYMHYALVADHWQYPAIGALIGLAVGGSACLLAKAGASRATQAGLAGATACVLGVLTLVRAHTLADAGRAWRKVLAAHPSWVAHLNLGTLARQYGRDEDALAHYSQALRLNPGYWRTHYNIGNVFLERGRPAAAVPHYSRALALRPCEAAALNNLGYVLAQMGREEEAVAAYSRAVEASPRATPAHVNLGDILMRKGRSAQAVAHFSQALRLNPRDVNVYAKLLACQRKLRQSEGERGPQANDEARKNGRMEEREDAARDE